MEPRDGAKILESQVVNQTSSYLVGTAIQDAGNTGYFTALNPFNKMWQIGMATANLSPVNDEVWPWKHIACWFFFILKYSVFAYICYYVAIAYLQLRYSHFIWPYYHSIEQTILIFEVIFWNSSSKIVVSTKNSIIFKVVVGFF